MQRKAEGATHPRNGERQARAVAYLSEFGIMSDSPI